VQGRAAYASNLLHLALPLLCRCCHSAATTPPRRNALRHKRGSSLTRIEHSVLNAT